MSRRRAQPGEARAWILAAIGSDTDTCIVWPFISEAKGYPMARWNGATHLAHRVVLTETSGAPEPGQEALHSCDVTLCCNPRHLRWGTHAENMSESVERGRYSCPRGERAGRSKLTAEQVLEIRQRTTETTTALAREYGISVPSMSDVRNGKSWRHLLDSEGDAA